MDLIFHHVSPGANCAIRPHLYNSSLLAEYYGICRLSVKPVACANSWGCAGPVTAFPDGYAHFDWKQLHRSSYAAIVNQPCTMWDGGRERVVSCEMLEAIEGGYGAAGYVCPAPDVAVVPSYRRAIIERY